MKSKLASDYFTRYENTDVEIKRLKTFGYIAIMETSDGKFWFSDYNDRVEILDWIDPWDVIYDENDGYVNVKFI